jgi:hypothetical protein
LVGPGSLLIGVATGGFPTGFRAICPRSLLLPARFGAVCPGSLASQGLFRSIRPSFSAIGALIGGLCPRRQGRNRSL